MAIAVYSDTELANLSRMPTAVFQRKLASLSMREALIFRRNLQISLASYSKRRGARDAFDPLQAAIIKACYLIEKTCRTTFLAATFAKAWRIGQLRGMSKAAVKTDVLKKWEKLIARSNY